MKSERDEITVARKRKRRKYNLKRTARFLAALLLVLVAIVAANTFTSTTFKDIGDFFAATFSASDGWPAALGESEPLQSERLTSAFAVVTSDDLVVISRSGARLLDKTHGFVSPFIAAAGNRIALCNRGSRDVRVYNRSSELVAFSAEGAIIDAALSSDGTLALLTESERYTCELSIYQNGLYERSMTWKGANGFPLLAALSPNGERAAAVTVSVAGGSLGSTVTVIDARREKELYSASVEGTVLRLILSNDGGFCAVTDTQTVRVSAGGETTASYDYGGRPLLASSADGSRLALVFGDNSRPAVNTCAVLDRNLTETSVITGCGIANALEVSGDRLYLLGRGRLNVYSASGELIKVYNTDIKAQNIVEFSSIIEILPDRAKRAEERELEETPVEQGAA